MGPVLKRRHFVVVLGLAASVIARTAPGKRLRPSRASLGSRWNGRQTCRVRRRVCATAPSASMGSGSAVLQSTTSGWTCRRASLLEAVHHFLHGV